MHRRTLWTRSATTLRRNVHNQQTISKAVQEIRELLSHTFTLLATSSSVSKSACNDAKALVANALLPRLPFSNDVFLHGERKLTELEAAQLRVSVEQRAKGKPLAYIIGKKEFWSMDFRVTKDTLIPRSDSEVLIETLVEQFHPQTPLQILDIGTGTGCLLLSALSEFPRATGVGIDISLGALEAAKENARFHNLDGRSNFVLRDLQTLPGLQNDDEAMYQRFDVILCNPPYIPRRELHLVEPDVLEYEPHLALFPDGGPTRKDTGADPDGLRMYQLLYESVDNLFKNHAERVKGFGEGVLGHHTTKNCLLMEIGSEDQARLVQKLFTRKVMTRNGGDMMEKESLLQFERFLYDASEKCRGLCFKTH
ncbi:unnamed protein product [Peronospora farinosa]|uniref:Peptide chain release factor N(5)-glutamine methyltransferase n=1 Tax=Peronospora farinosa TaxID=134698 RepID=A0AAV0ST85_9STRA|nr:unnamed protein product [Peronospora farinosa]CAI5707290.1 unnamed protein product [Peronospora farinosa]